MTDAQHPSHSSVYAWFVVAVLALANAVSFIDRLILSLLVQPIKAELAISDTAFSLLAGAAFAMRSDPESDQRELWLVLLGAFLASHLSAMASHSWYPDFPVQVTMCVTGFLSRRLTRFTLKFAGIIEGKGDAIADKVIDKFIGGD